MRCPERANLADRQASECPRYRRLRTRVMPGRLWMHQVWVSGYAADALSTDREIHPIVRGNARRDLPTEHARWDGERGSLPRGKRLKPERSPSGGRVREEQYRAVGCLRHALNGRFCPREHFVNGDSSERTY